MVAEICWIDCEEILPRKKLAPIVIFLFAEVPCGGVWLTHGGRILAQISSNDGKRFGSRSIAPHQGTVTTQKSPVNGEMSHKVRVWLGRTLSRKRCSVAMPSASSSRASVIQSAGQAICPVTFHSEPAEDSSRRARGVVQFTAMAHTSRKSHYRW